MKVSEVMTEDVEVASPDDTLQAAARMMADLDAGVLPVGEGGQLVGMITDRDIAVRGVAEGMGPDARVRDAMTPDVKYCYEDEDVSDVARNMGEQQLRRLPVLNRDKRLVGIVSIGDIALAADEEAVGEALGDISEPGGETSQTG